MVRNIGTVALAAFVTAFGAAHESLASGEFTWPNTGKLTSTWVYPNGAIHSGSADIAAATWTQIGASRAGTAYPFRDYYGANCVRIEHGAGYQTHYAHMVQWPSVYSGQRVSGNQRIGYVGSTGYSTGPHCHYAIVRYGTRLKIPNIWIGKYVTRGTVVPGTYSGLSGSTTSSVLFRAKVTAGAVNVRTGPSTGYAIVGTLSYGTIVNVYATSNSWYKIIYGGYYRWIAGWYTVRV